jgi:acyl-CoA synthetase (AMP-forming)/AMP-acid ligase II
MNIYSAVFSGVAVKGRQNDSAVAMIDLARKEAAAVTYAQLKAIVDSLRGSSDIQTGENVVLVMPNSLDLMVTLLAVWAQGAAAAPLNPSYTVHEFKVQNSRNLNLYHLQTADASQFRVFSPPSEPKQLLSVWATTRPAMCWRKHRQICISSK